MLSHVIFMVTLRERYSVFSTFAGVRLHEAFANSE
jgi:hypothetical protein